MKHLKVKGTGPAILCIHGSLGNKSQWRTFQTHFSANYRVIALDIIGYGGANKIQYSKEHKLIFEVEHVRSSIESLLGVDEQLVLIGHSYGASVALVFAELFPERVIGQVLCEPVSIHLLNDNALFEEIAQSADVIFEALKDDNNAAAVDEFLGFWSGAEISGQLSDFEKYMLQRAVPKVSSEYHAILNDRRKIEHLNSSVPTLLLSGNSAATPVRRVCALLQEHFRDITHEQSDVGHFDFIQSQVNYIELVENFLIKLEHSNLHQDS